MRACAVYILGVADTGLFMLGLLKILLIETQNPLSIYDGLLRPLRFAQGPRNDGSSHCNDLSRIEKGITKP